MDCSFSSLISEVSTEEVSCWLLGENWVGLGPRTIGSLRVSADFEAGLGLGAFSSVRDKASFGFLEPFFFFSLRFSEEAGICAGYILHE